MKKKLTMSHRNLRCQKRLKIHAKLGSFLVLLIVFGLQFNVVAQEKQLFTKNYVDKSVQSILMEIQDESDYRFVFMSEDVKVLKNVSKEFKNATVTEILDYCLKNSGLSYEVDGTNIVIYPKEKVESTPIEKKSKPTIEIKGNVVDKDGLPLPGATILEEGTSNGVTTDRDGIFNLSPDGSKSVLKISYIGFETQYIPIGDKTEINIVLLESTATLDEVIITGYQKVSVERSTGSAVTVKSEDMEKKGQSNLINTLEGMVAGLGVISNPNSEGSKKINIRGVATINGNTSL